MTRRALKHVRVFAVAEPFFQLGAGCRRPGVRLLLQSGGGRKARACDEVQRGGQLLEDRDPARKGHL